MTKMIFRVSKLTFIQKQSIVLVRSNFSPNILIAKL
jgi:hypothetical protein